MDKPLVLHSNLVCNPCFRRVQLLGTEETVLKALNEEFRIKRQPVKELAKVPLQFTSANLERNGSVPESPASIKSFITPKSKNRVQEIFTVRCRSAE